MTSEQISPLGVKASPSGAFQLLTPLALPDRLSYFIEYIAARRRFPRSTTLAKQRDSLLKASPTAPPLSIQRDGLCGESLAQYRNTGSQSGELAQDPLSSPPMLTIN